MAIMKLRPFEQPTAAGSGIALSLLEARGVQFIRIGITSAGQERYFGGSLTEKDALSIEIDDDAGKNHLIKLTLVDPEDKDAIPLSVGARGAVSIRLAPWRQVAGGKRPAKPMIVVAETAKSSVLCKLPEWARPDARKIGQGRSLMEN